MDLRSGDIVFGIDQNQTYCIEEFIDHGAFGLVYKIRGASDGITFALKTIITAALDPSKLDALLNEGRLAITIDHPNVIRYMFFHDGSQYENLPPYIIMEYADGGDLEHLISVRQTNNEQFSAQEIESIMLDLAQGMRAINQKLIHRDIRPSNILIVGDTLKISDFGLSKIVGEATRSRTFKGIQHVAYMAPEAWRLEKNTIQMDIYSMGIVFYELATLRHPYSAAQNINPIEAWRQAHLLQIPQQPDKANPSVSSRIAQTIMRMIAKRPEDRHESWDEIIERIQDTGSGDTTRISTDMSALVEKARSKQHQREILESEIRKQNEISQQRLQMVGFQAEQLYEQIEQIVNQFNQEYDGQKLRMNKATQDYLNGERPFIMIHGIGGDIRIFIHYLYRIIRQDQSDKLQIQEKMRYQNMPVWAWGYAVARSGKGFNVLLVPDNEDDLYGRWWALPIMHEPIARSDDGRPDPFPFDREHDLAEFLPLLNALHIYKSEPKPFSADLLISLIEEIL